MAQLSMNPETILDDLKEALRDGTITKEESIALHSTVKEFLDNDDGSLDKTVKGNVITVAAVLNKII